MMGDPVGVNPVVRRGVWAVTVWAVARWVSWLRGVWRRRVNTVVSIPVPAAECAHEADPDALMRRLLSAVNDPQRFAEVLTSFANCRGCSTAVVAQFAYELAGLVMDQQDAADQPAEEATCDCPVSPEVVAMRLTLSFDADDGAALGMALAQVWGCQSCLLSVVLALTRAHVTVMDDLTPSWRPVLERRLLELLDQATGRPGHNDGRH